MLKKELGVFDVFSIAAGAMISSGLFVLPGIAFAKAGPAVILSYALVGFLVIPTLLAATELVTAMPKSGGSYFIVERSMGPLAGTVAGLAIWISIAFKAAFAMVGIGALAAVFFGGNDWMVKFVASAGCVLFMLLNILSVKGTGRLQLFLVIGLLVILFGYCVKGFGAIDGQRYMPFMTNGFGSIFAVTGMVFVSFGGLTKVIDIAEEVKSTTRSLPLGMFAAFCIVNILYVLVVYVTVGVVPAEQLSGSLAPIRLGGEIIGGSWGAWLLSIAALLAFATTGNAGILSASRTPMAMSRDGLLPEVLSRTSQRFKTPQLAIIITGCFMILVIVVFSIEDLVKTASAMMLLLFVLMNASVVIMRYSGMQSYRPVFKVPLKPWLQIATIVVYVFLIIEMGTVPLLMAGAFALVAVLWYVFYVQRRIDRESAIVYLVKRIVSRHIHRSGLEEELKQIALERDQITPDRFDELIKNCVILDITKSISAKELFNKAADELGPKLGIEPSKLYELFIERERESSTVIQPGLAIPHVVIEGENVFEVMMVRCAEGVAFSELAAPVKTAFILVGSADERNYHLRALMSIAHVVSEDDFEKRWFAAKNVEQLRDIVLLSGRKRN